VSPEFAFGEVGVMVLRVLFLLVLRCCVVSLLRCCLPFVFVLLFVFCCSGWVRVFVLVCVQLLRCSWLACWLACCNFWALLVPLVINNIHLPLSKKK
jgi:hypothetical protein